MKTTYTTAFTKEYWDYISERWPEAYIDFIAFYIKQRKRFVDDVIEIWELSHERQLHMVIEFGQSVLLDFTTHYHSSYSCGLIYEWFCKYSLMKNYQEGNHFTVRKGALIPEAVYDLLPDRYKAG